MSFKFPRRRWLMIPVMAAVGLLTAGFWHGGHRNGGKSPEKMQRYAAAFTEDKLDELDATPEQRAEILALVKDLVTEGAKLREERGVAMDQFLDLWSQEKPEADAAHAAVDERIEKFREMAHKAVDAGLKVHATLTPSQREQVAEAVRERRERRGH
jgi:Spy/CpxP family protein refolding chaperone